MMIQMVAYNADTVLCLDTVRLPPYIDSTSLEDFRNGDWNPREIRAIKNLLGQVKRQSCTHQKNY